MSADGKLLLSFIKVIFLLAISLKESLYNVKYAVSATIMAKYIGWKKISQQPLQAPLPSQCLGNCHSLPLEVFMTTFFNVNTEVEFWAKQG